MKNKRLAGLAMALLLLAFVQFSLHAQAGMGRGRLNGVVVDETGKPVANATVSLEYENAGKKLEVITDRNGEWAFIGLGTGRANLMVVADGYLVTTDQLSISQLNRNPQVKVVLKEDKEKKARLKDEASVTLLDQGNNLFTQRKYADALTVFSQFAQNNPEIYQIYFNIGDCYREMQDYDTAIKQYEIAMEKAQLKADTVMQAKGYASIGEIFLRRNDFKSAQGYFKQSLDLNPKDEILAYNVAEIFFNNQKVEDAITYYTLATTIKPDWGTPYLKLGYAYLNKAEYPKALENFTKFLEVDPNSDQVQVVQSIVDYLKKMKK